MTREELLAKITVLKGYDNPQNAHIEADEALLEYINDVEISDAFYGIHKWYS